MILPDHRAVFGFDALTGNARADHFGQTIYVDGVDPKLALNLGAHALTPRLRAKDTNFQGDVFRLDIQALELFGNDQGV